MGMKFQCERDVLVDALSAAGRAVNTRGGALPVLSGVRFELTGDQLIVTGSDLDLTISVTASVSGEEDGVAVLPAYPAELEHVVDPTGAGDSFAGGLMGYLASTGKTDFSSIQTALAWGTVIASFTIELFGFGSLRELTRAQTD